MTTIYVSDPIHQQVLDDLVTLGEIHLGYGPQAIAYREVCDRVDAVMLRTETFTAEKIAASPRLKVIARHGVGSDNVDIPAATEHGVWVTVTPGQNSQSVAEHVFALILGLARHIPAAAAATVNGQWAAARDALVGGELHGKTLGLIGLGSIGSRVVPMAAGFGMTVLVTDPYITPEQAAAAGARKVDREELLATADVISLHVPLTSDTRHTINADAIARLKPGCLLVNTARGGLIDETALVQALQSGHLGGAALDVIEAESVDMKDPLPHNRIPLGDLPTLIVTPHVAGQTDDSLRNVGAAALTCIRQALAGRTPNHALNNPVRTAETTH
jgi:D-3-phosphoglycerate dehydrogenase